MTQYRRGFSRRYAIWKASRTTLNLVISIGITLLINFLGAHLGTLQSAELVGGVHVVLTYLQNYLESKGWVPQIFKWILGDIAGDWPDATPIY